MSKCKSCEAEIVWVETTSGKMMPCDPRVLQVVTADGFIRSGRVSHFATCPNAALHRRPK